MRNGPRDTPTLRFPVYQARHFSADLARGSAALLLAGFASAPRRKLEDGRDGAGLRSADVGRRPLDEERLFALVAGEPGRTVRALPTEGA